MSIIERVFKYEETELSIIKRQDDIWLRGKTKAEILGYSNPLKAIRTHFDSEDKREISEYPLPQIIRLTLKRGSYCSSTFDGNVKMEDKLMFGTDPEAFSGCDTKAKEDNEVTLTEDDIDDPMVKTDLSNLAKYSHDHLKAWLKYRGDN